MATLPCRSRPDRRFAALALTALAHAHAPTRARTGFGTYCVTERPLNSRIDMIEMFGKTMATSCPKHEAPAKHQEWKTSRDP